MEHGERMKDKHLKIRIQQCLALAEASNCPRRTASSGGRRDEAITRTSTLMRGPGCPSGARRDWLSRNRNRARWQGGGISHTLCKTKVPPCARKTAQASNCV